jgi:hypothetical protein
LELINNYISQYHAIVNGQVDASDVDLTLTKYKIVDPVYREWLIRTGGGPIGADWFDGLYELEVSQSKLTQENWNITGFVIGWDGAGNPIVMTKDGSIKTEDHNFGGIHEIAKSFTDLLTDRANS